MIQFSENSSLIVFKIESIFKIFFHWNMATQMMDTDWQIFQANLTRP